MRARFVCQAVTSKDGVRRVHFIADDGKQHGDVLFNIPADWFDNSETPREGREYHIQITEALSAPSREQRK